MSKKKPEQLNFADCSTLLEKSKKVHLVYSKKLYLKRYPSFEAFVRASGYSVGKAHNLLRIYELSQSVSSKYGDRLDLQQWLMLEKVPPTHRQEVLDVAFHDLARGKKLTKQTLEAAILLVIGIDPADLPLREFRAYYHLDSFVPKAELQQRIQELEDELARERKQVKKDFEVRVSLETQTLEAENQRLRSQLIKLQSSYKEALAELDSTKKLQPV